MVANVAKAVQLNIEELNEYKQKVVKLEVPHGLLLKENNEKGNINGTRGIEDPMVSLAERT